MAMLLSGAMPIAFFIAAFWFVSAYWCDKWELLKLSRRPVIYGNALSNHVMNILPYAAVRIKVLALVSCEKGCTLGGEHSMLPLDKLHRLGQASRL